MLLLPVHVWGQQPRPGLLPHVISSSSIADVLPMSWIEPLGEAGNQRAMALCVNESGLCRSGAHFLVAVEVGDPTHSVLTGGAYSIDGGAWHASTAAVFETHIIPPSNASVVFTFNVAALGQGATIAPRSLCVTVWGRDMVTRQTGGIQKPACVNFITSALLIKLGVLVSPYSKACRQSKLAFCLGIGLWYAQRLLVCAARSGTLRSCALYHVDADLVQCLYHTATTLARMNISYHHLK